MLSPEQLAHAAKVLRYLKVGDIVTHTRCMGMLAEHKYTGPGAHEWLCGTPTNDTTRMAARYGDRCHGETSNADDIHPSNITHINRVPIDVLDFVQPPWPAKDSDRWLTCGPSWPTIGLAVEGRWDRDNQSTYGFVVLHRLRGTSATWRHPDGHIVPFGPDFWRPA